MDNVSQTETGNNRLIGYGAQALGLLLLAVGGLEFLRGHASLDIINVALDTVRCGFMVGGVAFMAAGRFANRRTQ